MRSFPLTCTLLALPFSIVGCTAGPSPNPVPAAVQVTKVKLRVTRFPAGAVAKAPCEVTVVKAGPVAELVTWLQTIDWAQEGIDLKVAKVPEPDGTMALTAKDGAVQDFNFYWDGRVIHPRANRLLKGGDRAKLLKIVEGVCP